MTFDLNGNPKFLDPVDKATFESLLSAIKESFKSQGKKPIFEITISTIEKSITEKQVGLWKALVRLIAEHSGHTVTEVETTVLNQFTNDDERPENMPHQRFQQLIEHTTAFAVEFFELHIILSDDKFILKTKQ